MDALDWTQNLTRFGWTPLRHLGRGGRGRPLRLKGSMVGCRRTVPLFIYTLAFALQLRKSTENLSQIQSVVSIPARAPYSLFPGSQWKLLGGIECPIWQVYKWRTGSPATSQPWGWGQRWSSKRWLFIVQPLVPADNPKELHCNHSPGKRQIVYRIKLVGTFIT
jgi:hypothetical protein